MPFQGLEEEAKAAKAAAAAGGAAAGAAAAGAAAKDEPRPKKKARMTDARRAEKEEADAKFTALDTDEKLFNLKELLDKAGAVQDEQWEDLQKKVVAIAEMCIVLADTKGKQGEKLALVKSIWESVSDAAMEDDEPMAG